MAFLALGKARPELSSVQEALEELFPEHSHYRADALRAWEKRLRPTPDKTAKGDSGYSEGTDNSETNQDTQMNTNVLVKNHVNTHTAQHMDAHPLEKFIPHVQKSHKNNSCRKPAYLPNHLQRLHVRAAVREQQPSDIAPFKHEEGFRETAMYSPTLCESCLARKAKQESPELINPLSSRVPLPPVLRKHKENSHTEQDVGKLVVPRSPSPFQAISTDEDKTPTQLHVLNPLPGVGQVQKDIPTFDLPTDGRNVTSSDIERCYEIGRVVGDGNFAVVRECRHRNNRQTFAMKIVERSKLIGREHMMQNELSLLGSLCHPRIVQLFAHHHTHTHSYLVMELVSGGDLFEAISERGKISEVEAGLMVSDVSEALNYIHCKSIVHRDIKPENLLIERVAPSICRLKLGDFGLAMVVTEPIFTICGTPTYVAPEILCETGYGVAVDVWALGVILYILLCGFPPFRSRDRDQEELFQLIKQGQLHFPSPYWDPVSEEARSLVKALLRPDPTVRLTAGQTLVHPWPHSLLASILVRQVHLRHFSAVIAMSSLEERDMGVAAAPGSSSAGLGVGAVGAAVEAVAGVAAMQEEVGIRREGPEPDPDEPPKKRVKVPEGESGKLEERLYSVLCCTVCLDLPKASVYQCTNGHLMCAGCFIHLLADSRLKEEQATCPNCRCEISKNLCCRNLAVEKAVSELPTECTFCLKQFPRSSLERHQKEECQDRVTQCKYKRIGCPWQGPFHELIAHENECSHPTKTGTELMEILGEMDQNHRRDMQLYNSIFTLLCYEKIGFTEVQFRPYRTDDFITRLYYETPRFTVLNQTWVLKARVNDSERNPNLSCKRTLSFQLILKSKVNSALECSFLLLKGPYDDVRIKPVIHHHSFSNDANETDYVPLPISDSVECNKLLAAKNINLRLFIFQVQK
ncbi:hypothetical protein Q5P01_018252 [Channa striata]|uniref:Zinc finger TRAF-type-containing protein 1 n=1 Tax=Channa striata TaxID=64152 RepID=A0AA88M4X4_CHASR|nr:hypothetical protein Q5P01_018252 [Channa striata]